jgi:hypothetical protein
MFFSSRRPRPFHHTFIYYDERRERLRQLEKHAREELAAEGQVPKEGRAAEHLKEEGAEALRSFRPEVLRGTFLPADSRVHHRRPGLLSGNLLLIVLILLCVVLFVLML